MHDINSFRCQRQPMYGHDLVQTILSLCRQDPKKTSSASYPTGVWLWAGSLACQLLQTGVRPECGGLGSLPLSHCLTSYELRAASMEGTIRRWAVGSCVVLCVHLHSRRHFTLLTHHLSHTSLYTSLNSLITPFKTSHSSLISHLTLHFSHSLLVSPLAPLIYTHHTPTSHSSHSSHSSLLSLQVLHRSSPGHRPSNLPPLPPPSSLPRPSSEGAGALRGGGATVSHWSAALCGHRCLSAVP